MALFDALFEGIEYAALGQKVTASDSAHCQERIKFVECVKINRLICHTLQIVVDDFVHNISI